jgi:mannose-6-phosphate isomerase-like protein (cupin superfamily)
MTTGTLTKPLQKTFAKPDEVREFPRGRLEFINLPDRTLARVILQPGWRWSVDVRPAVGTPSCQTAHLQYVISGRLLVVTDAGERLELKPGDVVEIGPGHDALVLGNEPFVAIDIAGMKDYAKREPEPPTY